jgi:hypothetical protein
LENNLLFAIIIAIALFSINAILLVLIYRRVRRLDNVYERVNYKVNEISNTCHYNNSYIVNAREEIKKIYSLVKMVDSKFTSLVNKLFKHFDIEINPTQDKPVNNKKNIHRRKNKNVIPARYDHKD